ncbi:MAG: DNA polymerase I [Bacteroidales bacterium]|nr:DNA polymerase I [Bacteroidales bacterium]
MSPDKRLFLLDAYALIYRAYYAFIKNPRYNSKGLNTSAILGFTNTLLDILNNENPTHIAVVFDHPSPTFRHKMFKEYKANRETTPEDIKISVPYIKNIIKAFNIPVIDKAGFEADDIIGTLAKISEKKGYKCYMMTPDKDFGQLVSENIFIYKPKRFGNDAEIIGIEEIKKKYNINNPLQVIDILTLWGDTSDNVPGVPGIGEKTAISLISKFGSVEELVNNVDKLKGKQKENVANSFEQIGLSKKLVTIVNDVPVDFNENDLKISSPDNNSLKLIFDELEFKNLFKRLFNKETEKKEIKPASQLSLFDNISDTSKDNFINSNLKDINTTEHNYYIADNEQKRSDLINILSNQKEFCFDTETTSLDVHSAELVCISFSFKNNESYVVPISEKYEMAKSEVWEFKNIFENENIKKIGQNIKYDIHILKNYDINVKGALFDTMIAHYLIQPELRHNIDFLSEHFLSYKKIPTENLIGKKGKHQLSMRNIPFEKIVEYAGEDSDITWQLKNKLEEQLIIHKLENLFNAVEMPLIYVLATMEKNGVTINTETLNNYSIELRDEIIEVEKDIFKLTGTIFNISSPKQLGEILFDKLKITDKTKKTKTKQYSTSEETLTKLIDKHPIIRKILDYRSLKKLLNTYVDALPKLINPKTLKIHSSFNQFITATGRLSSTNPNLQNIPIREERGRKIRKSFISSDNEHILIAADYSQIELRIMAHMSEDSNMISAFVNNEDIHTATAAKIFNLSNDAVTKDMRRIAKTANFGIIYGISAFGLSQNLKISRNEAKELIDNYFVTYPNIKTYMDNNILSARQKGYVQTIMGRKRYLKDINSQNAIVRGNAERNAINAPIQGSAADIIKLAMINIHSELTNSNLKTKMILQVHDELVFDVYKPEMEEIKSMVREKMENVIKLKVPLIVDLGSGINWFEAH